MFFSLFQNSEFLWCVCVGGGGHAEGKRAKNGPNRQKILPVVLHISGTIDHMIVVYGQF